MSKFLTPPVWYDKNGNLNEMLTGEASGGGVAVGPVTSAYSNGVAIGSNAQASNGVAIGSNAQASSGVAVGSKADASIGGIAIGSNAQAASSDTIQLGDSTLPFMLNVGDGTGTLRIGDIAFQEMRIYNNKVSIGSPGVYLCCTTTGPVISASSDVAILFINDINNIASVLSSSAGSCSYDHNTQYIIAGTHFTMEYCFKIISF